MSRSLNTWLLSLKFYLLIVFGFVLSAHVAGAGDTVTLINFSKQYGLIKRDNFYSIDSNQVTLQLSDRIIVKASLSLSKASLAGMDEDINKVVELYQGQHFRYMMLELVGTDSLTTVLASLEGHPQILLLQSDVLQLHPLKMGNDHASYLPIAGDAGQPEVYKKNLVLN